MNNIVLVLHKIPNTDWFDNLIKSIARIYHFVSMRDIESYYEGGEKLTSVCHITFDDVDESFYQKAFPTLQKNSIPVTLFVSPNIGKKHFNYWFQILDEIKQHVDERCIKETICDQLGFEYAGVEDYEVSYLFKSMRMSDIERILRDIEKKHNVQMHGGCNITINQLMEVKNTGLATIGAHTMNHPILMNENDHAAQYEISQSIRELSMIMDEEIKYFAYPNGIPELDYGERERRILEENGIRLSFTTQDNHLKKKWRRYDMPRCGFIGSSRESTWWMLNKLFVLPYWPFLKKVLTRGKTEEVQRKAIARLFNENRTG